MSIASLCCTNVWISPPFFHQQYHIFLRLCVDRSRERQRIHLIVKRYHLVNNFLRSLMGNTAALEPAEEIGPAQHRPHVKQSDSDGETMLPSCSGLKFVSAIFLDIAMTIPRKDQEILAVVVSAGIVTRIIVLSES